MAGSVNKVILVGNLGRDPEVRNTQDGSKIVNLALATSETWNDKASGERKEKTEWHRVVIFNDRVADVAERYLKKGAKIYVEGSLQTRKWTDQGGQERYSTEVVIGRFNGQLTMLDARASGGDLGGYAGGMAEPPMGGAAPARERAPAAARPAAAARSGRWGSVVGCAARRRSGRRDSVLGYPGRGCIGGGGAGVAFATSAPRRAYDQQRRTSMPGKIVHIALKVKDLEVLDQILRRTYLVSVHVTTHRGKNSEHVSCHLTDGTIDLALLAYDSEDAPDALLSGPRAVHPSLGRRGRRHRGRR